MLFALSARAQSPLSTSRPPADIRMGEISNLGNHRSDRKDARSEGVTTSANSPIQFSPTRTQAAHESNPTTPVHLPLNVQVYVESHDTIIACAIWVLAFVALLQLFLFGYTYQANERNFEATETSARIANAALVAAARPKIIVRRVSVSRLEANYPVAIQFIVANVGGSPAHIFESNSTVLATANWDLPAIPPYQDYGEDRIGRHTLPSGTSVSITVDGKGTQPIKDLTTLRKDRIRILLLGYIQYRDDSGNIRRTAFCRQMGEHDPPRFSAVTDPDYEYAD
jgi:hypothetical protein